MTACTSAGVGVVVGGGGGAAVVVCVVVVGDVDGGVDSADGGEEVHCASSAVAAKMATGLATARPDMPTAGSYCVPAVALRRSRRWFRRGSE